MPTAGANRPPVYRPFIGARCFVGRPPSMLTPLELTREYPYPTHLPLRVMFATVAIQSFPGRR